MVHNRECPKCGRVFEFTRGKKKRFTMYGETIEAYEMRLICPEHGEFEPRVHEKLRQKFKELSE